MALPPSPEDQAYFGFQAVETAVDPLNDLDFVIQQRLRAVNSATLVQVVAVEGLTVDIQILVNQVDGAGNATPHGTIYGVPYVRIQGGSNAVIIDPAVGDIGLAVFCSRDISSVKVNKARANPGSRRLFDAADGVYVGGLLNGTPTQFVRFRPGGIELTSPTLITLTAPTIALDGAVTGTGAAIFDGSVTGAGVVLDTHRHTSTTVGTPTSTPIP